MSRETIANPTGHVRGEKSPADGDLRSLYFGHAQLVVRKRVTHSHHEFHVCLPGATLQGHCLRNRKAEFSFLRPLDARTDERTYVLSPS